MMYFFLLLPFLLFADGETGKADREAVELTLYKNMALVKEQRTVKLPLGIQTLSVQDIPNQIDASSVHANSLSHPEGFRILEQNYQAPNIDQTRLLQASLGEKIQVLQLEPEPSLKDAVLLSPDVVQIEGKVYLGHPGIKVLSSLPKGFIVKPRLDWLYQNKTSSNQSLQLTYLTYGMSWDLDYILAVRGKSASLKGWASLSNHCGVDFNKAEVFLAAGDFAGEPEQAVKAYALRKSSSDTVSESSFSDFHIYDLGRKVDLNSGSNKQVQLISETVDIQREYRVSNPSYYHHQRIGKTEQKADVFLNFSTHNAVLPAGKIRVFEEDARGALQFSGQMQTSHSPKGKELQVRIGHAFDIEVTKVQDTYTQISKNIHETSWMVHFENRKEEPVVVFYDESFSHTWELLESSQNSEKKDAFTLRFPVEIPARGSQSLKYSVRITQ